MLALLGQGSCAELGSEGQSLQCACTRLQGAGSVLQEFFRRPRESQDPSELSVTFTIGLYGRVQTDPRINQIEDSLKPRQALHHIRFERRRNRRSNRKNYQRRGLAEVAWIAADEKVVEQFHLLRRMKPLASISIGLDNRMNKSLTSTVASSNRPVFMAADIASNSPCSGDAAIEADSLGVGE